MTKLSKHFDSEEFACRDGCGRDDITPELIHVLERVRNHFDKTVQVTSGVRCLEHNRRQGSKDTSQHVKGLAADIVVKGVDPKQVADFLKEHPGGLGRYTTFTHIDMRNRKARWGRN